MPQAQRGSREPVSSRRRRVPAPSLPVLRTARRLGATARAPAIVVELLRTRFRRNRSRHLARLEIAIYPFIYFVE
ncbi:hypothetical protein WS67_01145 [Burkholderia singularis]|uniref:Uncharacterized protein n=1 Tax=Burkholderia singularis TaxID=1503053 RepID=A0A118DM00_9BURK|nr:hypothetical protein AQ611_06150 [Burkholderia sp. Bp7605]KVE24201.1 hypothetical protein WS67_01145 [Burkholderia singularis]